MNANELLRIEFLFEIGNRVIDGVFLAVDGTCKSKLVAGKEAGDARAIQELSALADAGRDTSWILRLPCLNHAGDCFMSWPVSGRGSAPADSLDFIQGAVEMARLNRLQKIVDRIHFEGL